MRLYPILVFVHITAAVAVIGISGVAAPVLHGRLRAAADVAEVRSLASLGAALARIERDAGIVTLLAGAALATLGSWWADAWIHVSLAVFFSSAVLASKVVEPAIHAVSVAATASTTVGVELERARWAPALLRGERHAIANDVVIVFLMTNKPGLWLAIVAVAVVHLSALLAGGRAVRRTPLSLAG